MNTAEKAELLSVEEYVLVAQDRLEITVFRRTNDWKPEVLTAPEARWPPWRG